MDPVTAFVSSIDNELITALSMLFHDRVHMIAIMAVIFIATTLLFKEKKRVPLLMLTVIIGFVAAGVVREMGGVDRPCTLVPGKVECPDGYSLPSGHALGAFSFAAAMMGSGSFPVYLLLSIFISSSRVYLGVHTFVDIAASLSIAFMSRCFAERLLKKK